MSEVCLHAADEVPLLRDLGVSVSPGTHTLFAVQTEVANDLGPPYGNCIQRARTRAVCMGDCEAAQVKHLCGCVDAYMPRVNNGKRTIIIYVRKSIDKRSYDISIRNRARK